MRLRPPDKLCKVYEFDRESVEEEKVTNSIQLSVDVGSTETRTIIFNNDLSRLDTVVAVDSKYSILENNIDWIISKSKELYDNLEICLTDITPDKDKKLFDEVSIIKGGLMEELKMPMEVFTSSVSKVDHMGSYINILSNIGLRVFMNNCAEKKYTDTISVDLTVSLPPMETKSEIRINKFKSFLAGTYLFKIPRMKYEVKIVLDKDYIFVEDESAAVLRYWFTVNEEHLNEFQRIIVLDGGGSTFDYAYLENGRLIKNGSLSLKVGGEIFEQKILDRFVSTHDLTPPNKIMIKEALATGNLQNGNDWINICECIEFAKKELTKLVMGGLNQMLSNNDLSPRQINLILCTGGCFQETEGSGGFVPSLVNFIEKEFHQYSEKTVLYRISEKYSILYGLTFYRVSI